MNTYGSSQELNFIVKTDIPVVVAKNKYLDWLHDRRKKKFILKQLSLVQVKAYLTAFLKQDTDTLIRYYQESKQQLAQSA